MEKLDIQKLCVLLDSSLQLTNKYGDIGRKIKNQISNIVQLPGTTSCWRNSCFRYYNFKQMFFEQMEFFVKKIKKSKIRYLVEKLKLKKKNSKNSVLLRIQEYEDRMEFAFFLRSGHSEPLFRLSRQMFLSLHIWIGSWLLGNVQRCSSCH